MYCFAPFNLFLFCFPCARVRRAVSDCSSSEQRISCPSQRKRQNFIGGSTNFFFSFRFVDVLFAVYVYRFRWSYWGLNLSKIEVFFCFCFVFQLVDAHPQALHKKLSYTGAISPSASGCPASSRARGEVSPAPTAGLRVSLTPECTGNVSGGSTSKTPRSNRVRLSRVYIIIRAKMHIHIDFFQNGWTRLSITLITTVYSTFIRNRSINRTMLLLLMMIHMSLMPDNLKGKSQPMYTNFRSHSWSIINWIFIDNLDLIAFSLD